MKLFMLSQDVNLKYNTFDSCVVCAENEEEAKMIHPDGGNVKYGIGSDRNRWAKSESIQVKYLGEADINIEKGVIVSSFNAS